MTHSDPERRKQIWWRWFLFRMHSRCDVWSGWCVPISAYACDLVSLVFSKMFHWKVEDDSCEPFFDFKQTHTGTRYWTALNQKKWILLAPNSQIIFRTMQWFLCVCVLFLLFVNVRYHSDTMSSPRKKWRDGRPEEFKIRTGFFGGWNPDFAVER